MEVSRCGVFEERNVIQSIDNFWSFSIVLINSSLLIFSLLLCFLGLLRNLFSLITVRLRPCRRYGIGHSLLRMSVINQLNFLFFVAHLIHLIVKSGENSSSSSVLEDDRGSSLDHPSLSRPIFLSSFFLSVSLSRTTYIYTSIDILVDGTKIKVIERMRFSSLFSSDTDCSFLIGMRDRLDERILLRSIYVSMCESSDDFSSCAYRNEANLLSVLNNNH